MAVEGRSLSMDLLLDGRWTSVEASDSDGVMVGAMLDAIDMVREWSPPLDEAMLTVLVCTPGALGYPPPFMEGKPFADGASEGARRFGMMRPLIV